MKKNSICFSKIIVWYLFLLLNVCFIGILSISVKSRKATLQTQAIIGGTNADKDKWKFFANILMLDKDQEKIELFEKFDQYRQCGGVLVDAEWVLTAYHCFPPYTDNVKLVAVDMYDLNKRYIFQNTKKIYNIKQIVNSGILGKDLALVQLDRKVTKTAPVPIYTKDVKEKTDVYMAGYGLDFHWATPAIPSEPKLPDSGYFKTQKTVLQELKLTYDPLIIPSNKFNLIVRRYYVVPAIPNKAAVCSGDSGGPLVIEENGTRYLIGILNTGGCEIYGNYTDQYFAKVTDDSTRKWINDTIASSKE